MKILHLAAGNRWTGAAAPAFAEVEALRSEGVDAHFGYVGGYKLEAKLTAHSHAHPIIERAQNPLSFLRSARAIRRLIREQAIDLIHAHLTYDHWLAQFAVRGTSARVARTFHSRRTLRTDPATRWLTRRTGSIFIVNETFREAALLRDRRTTFTPPPLDRRLFTRSGPNVRAQYSIDPAAKLITVIGKLSAGRGFEDAMRTFALVHEVNAAARLMIIGHGEHRPALEALAAELEIGSHVIWAGYHEDDLPEHYRAADALLFTAAGSDEGHRAVIEAMGCGVPPAVFPIAGMPAILGDHRDELIARESSPEALAEIVIRVVARRSDKLRDSVSAHADRFTFGPAAGRLLDGYSPS